MTQSTAFAAMAASIALPPSRSTCAPTSDAMRCGVAIHPRGTQELSGRYELDRARLDFEQRGQESDRLAVDVKPDLYRRTDRDPLPVHQLDLGVVLVQVFSLAEVVHAAHRFDLARILDQDHVEHPVGR